LTTQALLAQQELDRAKYLVERGSETKEVLDQGQQQLDGANAALVAGKDRVTEAQHALEASTHDIDLYTVNSADDALVALRDSRIQYRIANVGEVLPSGGKVFTMLDTSYVYMDIYLPAEQAGKANLDIVLSLVSSPTGPGRTRSAKRHEPGRRDVSQSRPEGCGRPSLCLQVMPRLPPPACRAHLPYSTFGMTVPSRALPTDATGNARSHVQRCGFSKQGSQRLLRNTAQHAAGPATM
jgi:HlyD family secretion protein